MNTLLLLAVVGQGLMAGALLTEGAVLVPFWRKLPADEFLAWYRTNAALLMRLFAPLEVVVTVATVAATAMAFVQDAGAFTSNAKGYLVVASALSLAVLAAFPLYFQSANASFADGSLEESDVPGELARWGRWHWVRVAIATAAFTATVLAALAR